MSHRENDRTLPAMVLTQATSRMTSQVGRALRACLVSRAGAFSLAVAGLVVATALALALGRFLQISTAAVWVYLPLVLLVTLRWGSVRGSVAALAACLIVLTTLVPPIGRPMATDPRAYTRLAISMIGMLVAVLTVADLNRRRLASERRGRAEAERLAEIGRRISSILDLEQVLQTVVESAQGLVAADMAQIALAIDDGALRVVAMVGQRGESSLGTVIEPGKGVGGRAFASSAPFQVVAYQTATDLEHTPMLDAQTAAEGNQSMLAVPILHRGRAEGVLWVFSRRARRFTSEEISLLERLAAQAAVGIVNARVHAEEQAARAEIEALLAATATLSTQDEPEAALRTLVEQAASLLHAERASYAVPRDGELVTPAYLLKGIWCEDEQPTRPIGLLLRVWETGVAERSNDMGGAVIRGYPRRTQLTVPILGRDGSNLGVLALNNKEDDADFTAHDQRLLEAICETGAAVLIRTIETSTRLGAEQTAERRKREVEALLAAADQLNSAVETEEVLRRVVSIAVDVLGVRRAGIVTNEGDHAMRRYTLNEGVWRPEATRLPLDDSIGGWVILHGQTYRTDNVAGNRLTFYPASGMGTPVSALSVPITGCEGYIFGSLNMFERRDMLPFSDEDQRLAEGIAHHAAVALERATLTTELRQMAEALRTAAKFNEEVIAGASQGIVVYDRALHYVAFNPFMERLTGLPSEQVLGKSALELFPHLRANKVDKLLQRALRGETVSTPDTAYSVPLTDHAGWVVSTFAPHRDATGAIIGVIGTVNEVTQRKTLEQSLERQAFLDTLTRLPNRAYFMDCLTNALNSPGPRKSGVGVLFLDLDGFKVVNDSLGHPAGDALLKAVGERLEGSRRAGDTIARFGGDEFAVLLEDVSGPDDAKRIADRILLALKRPFTAAGHRGMFVGASIGIAFRDASDNRSSAEDLIREADIALYRAKAAGKGRAVFFTTSMGVEAVERLELQTDMQRALRRDEFRLHYQPIIRLRDGGITGAEALVRWNHPRRGFLGPDSFIPLAEESGLILPLGGWVLEEACKQAVAWQTLGRRAEHPTVSVNLSARQFEQPNLLEQVASALGRSGLSADGLVLEITETAVIRDLETAVPTLAALKSLGVRVAIDDFGTGYSSLSYLERLQVDILKIDRSFLQRLERSSGTRAIVQATIVMAHALGMEVTAEGIETAEQLSTLTDLDCDSGQGYFFHRPCPPAELESLLAQRQPSTPAGIAARAV